MDTFKDFLQKETEKKQKNTSSEKKKTITYEEFQEFKANNLLN